MSHYPCKHNPESLIILLLQKFRWEESCWCTRDFQEECNCERKNQEREVFPATIWILSGKDVTEESLNLVKNREQMVNYHIQKYSAHLSGAWASFISCTNAHSTMHVLYVKNPSLKYNKFWMMMVFPRGFVNTFAWGSLPFSGELASCCLVKVLSMTIERLFD